MKHLESQVLYISIDGIMEPLGYSQVLKYLEKLSISHKINLISFEKKIDLRNQSQLNFLIKKCNKHNISWYRLKYRSGFFGLGQLMNIFNLIFVPLKIFITRDISLMHIRSYMPGISIPLLKKIFKFKLIFDIRGFWPDEKHDRLNWSKQSLKYRFFKKLEHYLMSSSEYIVTLTNASKNIITKNFNLPLASVIVIPTCVDFNEFKRIEHSARPCSLNIGYLGSVDTAYDFTKFCFLISQLLEVYEGSIHLKVLTNQSAEDVSALIPKKILPQLKLEVKYVERAKLSEEISSFDFLGFCLKENFSIVASMPTKIGETLACGVPIVCNSFNSDIDRLLEDNEAGMIYDFKKNLSEIQIKKLFDLLENKNTALKCSWVANEYFSLEKGASKYLNLYSQTIS
jgi:glycosyltransferase involved in cell wall biosynthesis